MSNVTIAAEQVELAKRHAQDQEFATLVEALDASSTDCCVGCGRMLGGLLGTFQWGIVNGQGECGNCGFPYVYYHRHEVEPAAHYLDEEVAPAKELLIMAWVPNAEIPLAAEEEKP